MKKKVAKYIKRPRVGEALQLRIDGKLKQQVKISASKMNSNLNRFTEAALTYYIEMLKKEGSL